MIASDAMYDEQLSALLVISVLAGQNLSVLEIVHAIVLGEI